MVEVVAAVIEYQNKLLAFQRGAAKYTYVANKFEFPGGKVERGEDLRAAPHPRAYRRVRSASRSL